MYKSKVLMGFVILAYLLFVVFQITGHDSLSNTFRYLIMPLIAVAYFFNTETKRTLFFSLFFICYSVSDLLGIASNYIDVEVEYFIGNALYILAYLFLLLEVCRSICIIHVLKNFKIHLLVLTGLNIYIAYVLLIIVKPYTYFSEYLVEIIYNIVMLLLLSASLINYFYKDDKKSLLLFIGSLCIVFSEVIGIAYMYISEKELLNFLATTLSLFAFYSYYLQARIEHEKVKKIILEDC